jgi:hypothetical protein
VFTQATILKWLSEILIVDVVSISIFEDKSEVVVTVCIYKERQMSGPSFSAAIFKL